MRYDTMRYDTIRYETIYAIRYVTIQLGSFNAVFYSHYAPSVGDSLLHMAASKGRQNAALFLACCGAQPNVTNKLGETPLHAACRSGLTSLISKLLHW